MPFRLLLLLLCFVADPVLGQKGLSKKTRTLFEWFDSLGYEDTSKAKFIRIRTGASQSSGTQQWFDTSAGFLLEDNGPTFRAVLADLTIALCTKGGKDETDENYRGYRELNIEDEGKTVLKDLQKRDYFKAWEDGSPYSYEDRLARFAQIFVLARACAQRGHGVLAESLVQALEKHPSRDGLNPSSGTLRSDLENVIDQPASWNFRLSVRDSAQNWESLRTQAVQLHKAFPNGGYDTWANICAEMAKKDAEHAQTAPKSLEGLAPAEKARELVWRLREEQDEKLDEGDYWSRPWPFKRLETNGAMKGLREMGFAAVPALLAELHAPHASRSVFRNSRFGGGVLRRTTGDHALSVLNDIAGINFYWLTKSDAPGDRHDDVIRKVEEWWSQVEPKGEKAWLVEKVRGGGRNASTCVDRLLEKFPEEFTDAAIAGFDASIDLLDSYPRQELLRRLERHRGERTEKFLMEKLNALPAGATRVSVARVLRGWGHARADAAIAADWKQLAARKFQPDPGMKPVNRHPFGEVDDAGDMLEFVVTGDSMECFQVLLGAWPDMPTRLRERTVDTIRRRNKASAPVNALMQEILFTALEDTTRFDGSIYTNESGSVVSPRLADMAAHALSERWPEKFKFDQFASSAKRERQRITILNSQRRLLGKPELPLPAELPKVSNSQANHVTHIVWTAAPTTVMKKAIDGWMNRPLNAEAVAKYLAQYVRKPFPGTKGIRLAVERAEDSTGIVIRISVIPGVVGRDAGCNATSTVNAKDEVLHNSGGSGTRGSYEKASCWDDFQRALERALKIPSERWFEAAVSLEFSD